MTGVKFLWYGIVMYFKHMTLRVLDIDTRKYQLHVESGFLDRNLDYQRRLE